MQRKHVPEMRKDDELIVTPRFVLAISEIQDAKPIMISQLQPNPVYEIYFHTHEIGRNGGTGYLFFTHDGYMLARCTRLTNEEKGNVVTRVYKGDWRSDLLHRRGEEYRVWDEHYTNLNNDGPLDYARAEAVRLYQEGGIVEAARRSA